VLGVSSTLHFVESVLDSRTFERTRSFKECPSNGEKAFTTSTVPLALFQARFTVYRLCGWIDAARRVYGTPRFVALPAVHSHATPPVCCHYPRPRPGPAKNIIGVSETIFREQLFVSLLAQQNVEL